MKSPVNQLSKLLLCAGIAVFSSQAYAECTLPSAPIVPDGNVASTDELIAAQKGLKSYQSNLVEYRACLATEQERLAASIDDDEKSALVKEQEKVLIDAYNDSVSNEEAAADEFNTALRAYKSRQN